MSGNQHTHMGTFRISKSLLNNTLSLQSFAYVDLTDGAIYNRLSADYALNDHRAKRGQTPFGSFWLLIKISSLLHRTGFLPRAA